MKEIPELISSGPIHKNTQFALAQEVAAEEVDHRQRDVLSRVLGGACGSATPVCRSHGRGAAV